MINDYVIELVRESYTPGEGGIYILYNHKTKEVIAHHFSTNDNYALNDLLSQIPDEEYTYTIHGERYYED